MILAAPGLRGQDTGSTMFANAEAYERFMGRWSRLVAPLLVHFTGIPDAVDSGTGSLAFSIAKMKVHSHVLGIDPSKEYVEYANSQNSFPDRVSFQIGDAQQLRFPDATFQTSVSLLVFNFIPDTKEALSEIRRVTKAGGLISAAVWDYGEGMRMLRVFWDAAASVDAAAGKHDEKHMPLCRAGELAQLWKQSGLEHVHEQPLDITMRFESFADYWDPFLLGQGPAGAYVRSIDGDHRRSLRSAVNRQLSTKTSDEPFALTARAWAVRGTVPIRS
jgi:SAM-dependent methyltransferase